MQFSPSALLALGLALVQTSFAFPAPAGALSKRVVDNLPPSDQSVACPGYRYSLHQVERAIQRGIDTTQTIEAQPGGFPHEFGNNRQLPLSDKCKGKRLYEFPLLHGDSIYGGDKPGADRVVFYIYSDDPETKPTENGAYCGVMTRDGAPRGDFLLCKVEDQM